MATLDNGAACWAGALAPLLAGDAWLIRHGHRSLSQHAGAHPALTAGLLAYLCLHLLGRFFLPPSIQRLDPLSLAARRLERST